MSEFNYYVNGNANGFLKNGNDFLEAAKRSAGMKEDGSISVLGTDGPRMIPSATVVNAVFAMEMYLKALLLKTKGSYPKGKDGHNLLTLYEELPNETKQFIDKIIGYSKDGHPLFAKFASIHKTDFVNIRYYVENCGWEGMDPLMMIAYAFNLGQATNWYFSK